MKKISAVLLVLLFAAAAIPESGAMVDPDKIVVVKGEEDMKLVYLSDNEILVKIRLLDSRGNEIASRKINSIDGFMESFNFKGLKEGRYAFELTDYSGTVRKEVVHRRNLVRNNSISSIFQIEGTSRFRVSVLADDQPVSIRISDSNGEVLFIDKRRRSNSFSRTFDLSFISDKAVKFEVSSGDQTDIYIK